MYQETNPDDLLRQITASLQIARGWSFDSLQREKREAWRKAAERVSIHLKGEMPDAIKEQFPNETPRQLQFRKETHESLSQARLEQAIEDVRGVIMGKQFYYQLRNPQIQEYVDSMRLSGDKKTDLVSYLFDVAYPVRVADPNAVLAVVPTFENADNPSEKPTLELRIFKSANVVYFVPNVLCIAQMPNEMDGGRIVGSKYRIFAPNVYLEILHPTGAESPRIVRYQAHQNNEIGAFQLGGKPVVKLDDDGQNWMYYESDFRKAVPAMNTLEKHNAQSTALKFNVSFPTRVVSGLDCSVCDGRGYTDKRNEKGELCFDHKGDPERAVCGTCKGSKTLPLSALDTIIVPKDKTGLGTQPVGAIAETVIGYVSPPTENLQVLISEVETYKKEVDNALNLTRTSETAQSGEAKRRDRESKYTQLKTIADSLSALLSNVLHTVIKYYFFLDANGLELALRELTVYAPQNFDILSPSDSEAALYDNYPSKPLAIRQEQYLQVLASQFPDNAAIAYAARMAYAYTKGLNRLTPDEAQTFVANGFATSDEIARAVRAEAVIGYLIAGAAPDELPNRESLFAQLDAEFNRILPPPPPIINAPANG